MAFNPFSSFRKNAKRWFAVLVIVCMVTFVLSFGAGDAFEQLRQALGSRSQAGAEVIDLYGDTIHEGDISEIRYQRQLANDFFWSALVHRENTLNSQIFPPEGEKPDAFQSAFQQFLFYRQLLESPQARDMFDSPDFLRQYQQAQMRFQTELEKLDSAKKERVTQLLTIRQLRAAWAENIRVQDTQGRAAPMIFGGETGEEEDVLDFMVWKHQAEELDIVLSDEDVRKILAAALEGESPLTEDEAVNTQRISGYFKNRGADRITPEIIYEALRQEMRVVLAKRAILGGDADVGLFAALPSPFAPFSPVTPSEMLRFYRDQRTTVSVSMLAVPVESFLSQVEKEPSERELRDLYEQYRDQLPNPASRLPAFKIPQKFALEWVSDFPIPDPPMGDIPEHFPATGILKELDDPAAGYYMKEAKRHTISMIASRSPLQWLWLDLRTRTFYDLLESESNYGDTQGGYFSAPSLLEDPRMAAAAVALNFNRTAAATVGHVAMPSNTLLGGVITSQVTPLVRLKEFVEKKKFPKLMKFFSEYETERRAPLLAGLVASGFTPPLATTGLWSHGATMPMKISRETARIAVIDRAVVEEAKQLLQDNLTKFTEELAEIEVFEDDDTKARQFIDEALKKYRLEDYHGRTDGVVQETTAAENPELEPFLHLMRGTGPNPQPPEVTVRSLFKDGFQNSAIYRPSTARVPGGSFDSQQSVRYWKTKNEAAREPSFQEAREEVEKAWRLRQARRLARERAREISKEIAKQSNEGDVEKRFRELAEKNEGWEFIMDLPGIAKQVPPTSFGTGRALQAYTVPSTVIKYPKESFVANVTEMEKGGTSVQSDLPEKHFYVVYAKEKYVPDAEEVILERRRSGVSFPGHPATESRGEMLWAAAQSKERQEYQEMIMKELRRQAAPVDSRGRYELKLKRDRKEDEQ